jgi:hypothetical protein
LTESQARGGEDAPALRLSIEPSRVSVEARRVRVAEVLAALGAEMSFIVTGAGSGAPVEHLSVQGASLADVVRQLLREEDHAIVYRDEAPSRIDTIVLLGSRGLSAPSERSATDRGGIASTRPDGPLDVGGSAPAGPEPGPEASAVASQSSRDLEALLTAHARPGSPSEPDRGRPVAAGAPSGTQSGSGPVVPPSGRAMTGALAVEPDLAAATRKAQENLRLLIESLGAAARPLLEPVPLSR